MAPKKYNAFMMFVQEWRHNNPQGKDLAFSQAVKPCDVMWQKMTKQERSPYEDEAKKANLLLRENPNNRIAQIDRTQREVNKRLEEMKRRTEKFVMEAVEAKDLENTKFIFVHFNIFTKTQSGDMYIPAEFAAVEFSLKQGIVSGYSTLINPGRIDMGQGHDAQHHSSTTHNLPLPPNALGERDCKKIHNDIFNYFGKCRGCKTISVFTTTWAVPLVKTCFDFLAPENHALLMDILSLDYLLFLLKKEVLQAAGLFDIDKLSKVDTDAYIKEDQFEFSPKIACEFHEAIDRSKYCSQSMVRRWAYSFCHYLCGDLNITLKPGKHIPPPDDDSGKHIFTMGNSEEDSGAEKDKESSVKVWEYPCLAGFGRGRARGRLPTLGEACR